MFWKTSSVGFRCLLSILSCEIRPCQIRLLTKSMIYVIQNQFWPLLSSSPYNTYAVVQNYTYVVKTSLTHRGRMTHICASRLIIIGSDNGLSPGRCQASIWTSAGILLIRTLGINFSQILREIRASLFKKMHLIMSSAKWRHICHNIKTSKRSDACIHHITKPQLGQLTYLPWDKMAAISKTTFSNKNVLITITITTVYSQRSN